MHSPKPLYTIDFVVDLTNEDDIFWEAEVDAKYYFMHGGCFELYKIVHHYFPNSICMIENSLEHCAIGYDDEIYDAEGKVNNKDAFHIATKEDIEYMERKFGHHLMNLEAPKIIEDIKDCNIKGILY